MLVARNMLFILYVADQKRSREFYKNVFLSDPVLEVPGMTEFTINDNCTLGLMPENGIAKILGNALPSPSEGNGIPRCELYFTIEEPQTYILRAINAGAKEISSYQLRNWGDYAGYVSDPDGHIIAFAKTNKSQ